MRQTVRIVAGENITRVNVTVMDDKIVEGDETFNMRFTILSSLAPEVIAGSVTSATGIIIDTSSK